jgi:galactitol-specific phosphotransferase system IIB component
VSVDRAFLAHVNIPAALAADSDGMKDNATTSTTAITTISTFLRQLDWPRNIVVVVAATTAADIAAGNIVVTGLNFADEVITETHAVTADTAGTFTGTKAFKTVTSVAVPIQDGASVTIDIGWGMIFGLPYKLYADELVILKLFNKSVDAATVVADATDIEKNTVDMAGTPDGVKDIDLYVIV